MRTQPHIIMAKNKQKFNQKANFQAPKAETATLTASNNNGFSLSPTLAYIILGVCVIAAFAGGFSNGFVNWDDQMYATENIMIQNPTF